MTNSTCTDLWDAPDGAAEGGAVACDDGAAHQRVRELWSLGEVMLLVVGRLVHDSCRDREEVRFLRRHLRFHTQLSVFIYSRRTRRNVYATCFLDVGAVFCVAGVVARADQVDGVGSEDVLVAHDEVGHDAVGPSVMVEDGVPLLHTNHRKHSINKYVQYI